MKLQSVWTGILYVFDLISLSPQGSKPLPETPLPAVPLSSIPVPAVSEIPHKFDDDDDGATSLVKKPTINVPRRDEGDFICEYPDMIVEDWQWHGCYSSKHRDCWLEFQRPGSRDRKEYNIDTDYDDPKEVPKGIVREYWLEIADMPISPDGVTMEHGKVFNRTYPGPWIEACWGDTIRVHVTNKLRFNGTSIHFHGIRMLNNVHNDGVNGVTQCPIAPGDSYTYEFHATQYGSSWYHSHYSLQYGDGAVGPITIYGPSTANYGENEAFRPILLTDWNHRSVFEDYSVMLEEGKAPEMTNILLNGTGQFGPSGPHRPKKFQMKFDKDKSTHFIRIINTAVDTTFIFTIDDHMLEVIEADFVPIEPYNTTNILVGIGQRYHVIVRKHENSTHTRPNYWIRTIPASKCSKFYCGPDEQMGIVRYDESNSKNPVTEPFLFGRLCSDEPYEKLIPRLKWTVGPPSNNVSDDKSFIFEVGRHNIGGAPYHPSKNLTRWDMHLAPLRIDFSEPTILNATHAQEKYAKHLSVVTTKGNDTQWIWLVITAPGDVPPDGARSFIPAAHPMHLHGHDFALLKQSENRWIDDRERFELNCENPSAINCTNPPRRDVVLLPANGYVIIAFKADNPGVWLVHCHIAYHASDGLAMQIIENGDRIEKMIGETSLTEVNRVCGNWNKWFDHDLNHWDFQNPDLFQDDSGV